MTTQKHSPVEQLREKASHIRHDMEDIGQITKDVAQDTLIHLRKNANEYYKQGMDKAQDMEKNLESNIKKHPMRSVLIAAGIGLLIGAIWKRK